jgi:hypothetical protein
MEGKLRVSVLCAEPLNLTDKPLPLAHGFRWTSRTVFLFPYSDESTTPHLNTNSIDHALSLRAALKSASIYLVHYYITTANMDITDRKHDVPRRHDQQRDMLDR